MFYIFREICIYMAFRLISQLQQVFYDSTNISFQSCLSKTKVYWCSLSDSKTKHNTYYSWYVVMNNNYFHNIQKTLMYKIKKKDFRLWSNKKNSIVINFYAIARLFWMGKEKKTQKVKCVSYIWQVIFHFQYSKFDLCKFDGFGYEEKKKNTDS
jgi:hypothetical protein